MTFILDWICVFGMALYFWATGWRPRDVATGYAVMQRGMP